MLRKPRIRYKGVFYHPIEYRNRQKCEIVKPKSIYNRIRKEYTMTDGERYFEVFCNYHYLKYEKIEEKKDVRTPDYRLFIGDYLIITEVKDLESNKEDEKALKEFYEKGYVIWGGSKVGNRVRNKIIASKDQLKRFTENKYPSILLLFDHRNEITPTLTDYEIKIGMYGFEAIKINTNDNPNLRKYGGKAQMTKNSRKYISCIGLLTKENNNKLFLKLYENYYANIKIEYDIFEKYDDISIFKLNVPPDKIYSNWASI